MSSTEASWESVASILDVRAAHNLAELLQAELIPTRVVAATHHVSAAASWEVEVPADQVATAQRLMESSRLTDAELSYLASGDLDGE